VDVYEGTAKLLGTKLDDELRDRKKIKSRMGTGGSGGKKRKTSSEIKNAKHEGVVGYHLCFCHQAEGMKAG